MKKAIKIIVPLVMIIAIIASIGWYLFVYDRDFTRDMLLNQARYYSDNRNDKAASWFYGLAYEYTSQDEHIAIELANQYKADGNYTKAEYTLTNAIADGGTADLYIALCKTYVEQDKLLDAVTMLDNIANPAIKQEIEAMRPAAPAVSPEPGFYSQYIDVEIRSDAGTVYSTVGGDYPSMEKDAYTAPYSLPVGETVIYAIAVGENGLVSPRIRFDYTVGGIVEPVIFTDAAMETAVREVLKVDAGTIIYTNDLWPITTFTVPEEVKNFDDLKYLPNLQNLTMQNQDLDTLACLLPLDKLQVVDLTGCRFPADSMKVFASLPELQRLTLADCGLSTIAPLEGCRNLTHLNLANNTIRNLDVLSGMNTLVDIDLQHNAVTDLSKLSGLGTLERLNISFNSVTTLDPIATCSRLTWLDASNNTIAVLSAVDKLSVLGYLSVSHNMLTDVAILAECTALTELHIASNEITDITMLSTLVKLDTFDFSHNQVEALPAWDSSLPLRIINGSHNKLESIDQLKDMEHLSYVYMDYNKLTSIDAIAECYRLILVNVYGNEIEDVSALTAHDIIVNYDPTNK